MRILHFSNKPAFPSIDGGCVAIREMLYTLSELRPAKLVHFTLSTYKHPFHIKNYPANLPKSLSIHSAEIDTSLSILGAAKHLISNKSYNVERFYNSAVASKLESVLKEHQFDCVVIESIFLLPYLTLFKSFDLIVLVRTHNVEFEIWESLSLKEKSVIKRKYLQKLTKQLRKYELQELKKVDGIIAISDTDKKHFKSHGIEVPITVIPTAIQTSKDKTDYSKNDFYYLGAMDWKPNIEGFTWLFNHLSTQKELPAKLHLAGKNLDKNAFVAPQIENHGEIICANTFIQNHGICLVPILSGSGIKIKLLENMALGKPIITTVEGTRGIRVRNGEEVLIANSQQQFYDAMILLYKDKELRQKLGENAKKFIFDNYNLANLSKQLGEFIAKIQA